MAQTLFFASLPPYFFLPTFLSLHQYNSNSSFSFYVSSIVHSRNQFVNLSQKQEQYVFLEGISPSYSEGNNNGSKAIGAHKHCIRLTKRDFFLSLI